jgi:glycosyltransferase involved in cell wall biosynthesis
VNTPKRMLRPWRCLVYEQRNRFVGRRSIKENQRFHARELTRLRAALTSGCPRARVIVVVPTYNRPDGVVRAVESALAQTFRNLAVVVVDDGAGLPELPTDPRLVAVSLSRNSATLGLVRNIGIDLSDSEFIAFLDDDNVWTPEHVATAVSALDADPGLSAVYTSVSRMRPDGTELDVLDSAFDRRRLRWDPYIDANSVVVRRSCNRGFSVLPRTKRTLPKEDWEYVWQLSRRGRIEHVPKVTVRYAINPDSFFTDWADDARV